MFIARWSVDVRFGHKEEAASILHKWNEEVGAKVGFDMGRSRIVTGSIGALESRYETEFQVPTLDALDKAWTAMMQVPSHKKFAKELEPHVVSGTNRWEIYRVVE